MSETAQDVETWEIQIPGSVWVYRNNPVTGLWDQVRANGTVGPKRIQITKRDREYTQVMIRDDRREQLDPFTNGTLAQVVDGEVVGEKTTENIARYLEVKDQAFAEAIEELDELTIRRLMDLAMVNGTVPQVDAIRDVIDRKYRVGGTQRTVREMYESGEMDRMTISGS